MTHPTIHLNGTSKSELLENLIEAGAACQHAIKKVAETAPNGRDYYTQDRNAFKQANIEHHSRLDRLKAVLAELEEMMEHIAQHD